MQCKYLSTSSPSLFEKLSTKPDITSTEISYPFLAPKVSVLRRNKVTHSSTSTDPLSAATKTLVLGNLFKQVWFAITFARAVCHWREWQEWDNCQNFFIVFIPKWQTFRANVMSSLKTLNKLPIQVQGLSVQLKNGRLEVLELLALFLLKTETCDAKNS